MRYSERRFPVGTSLEAGQRRIACNCLGNRCKEWKLHFAKCELLSAQKLPQFLGFPSPLLLPLLLLTFKAVRNLKDIRRRVNSL